MRFKKYIEKGMTLVLRDGTRRLVQDDLALVCDPTCGAKYGTGPVLYLDEYCDRLLHANPAYDVMAVWDPNIGPLWWREVADHNSKIKGDQNNGN